MIPDRAARTGHEENVRLAVAGIPSLHQGVQLWADDGVAIVHADLALDVKCCGKAWRERVVETERIARLVVLDHRHGAADVRQRFGNGVRTESADETARG